MSKIEQIQFVSTTPDDLANSLAEKVYEMIKSKLQGLKATPEKKEYITREEAATFLNVTPTTLWRYAKRGKLIPHYFENKVYYKLSEIEQGFTKND